MRSVLIFLSLLRQSYAWVWAFGRSKLKQQRLFFLIPSQFLNNRLAHLSLGLHLQKGPKTYNWVGFWCSSPRKYLFWCEETKLYSSDITFFVLNHFNMRSFCESKNQIEEETRMLEADTTEWFCCSSIFTLGITKQQLNKSRQEIVTYSQSYFCNRLYFFMASNGSSKESEQSKPVSMQQSWLSLHDPSAYASQRWSW